MIFSKTRAKTKKVKTKKVKMALLALLAVAVPGAHSQAEWATAYTGEECAVEYQIREGTEWVRGDSKLGSQGAKPRDPGARSLEECKQACTDANNCVGITFFTGDTWKDPAYEGASAPTDEEVHTACCQTAADHYNLNNPDYVQPEGCGRCTTALYTANGDWRGCDGDVPGMPPASCTGGYYSGCSRCTSLNPDPGLFTSDLGYTYTTFVHPSATCPGGGGYKADTTCATCPAGRSGVSGDNLCRACARDRYASEPNQAECLLCPSGKVAEEYGSTTASNCSVDCGAIGEFSHSTGCVSVCPVHTYQDEAGTGCITCPDKKGTGSQKGAPDVSYCSSCLEGYAAVGNLCTACPAAGESSTLLSLGGAVLLALASIVHIYRVAQKASLEDEQAMESNTDSAKAAASDLKSTIDEALEDDVADDATAASPTGTNDQVVESADEQPSHTMPMSAMLSILFPSVQLSLVAWSLNASWPVFMEAIAAWLSIIAMPDFGAVMRADCMIDTGGGSEAAAFLNFATKQAMIASLAVVYGLLYLCGQPARKRGAVHAMGAFYSLLFLGFAEDAFYMTATTGVEGPDYNGSSVMNECGTEETCQDNCATVTQDGKEVLTCTLSGNYRHINSMPSIQNNIVDTQYYYMLALGWVVVIIYVVAIPLFYLRKLRKASEVGAYLDGNKLCVGQELWSVEFSQKYAWWYTRFNHHAWNHEFVIMGRKALLSAGVFLSGYPLLQVIYSMVVIVLSVVQQKRSNPYLAGKHVIREGELEGATITRADAADAQGCCCRCCGTFASSFILLGLTLACLIAGAVLEESGVVAESGALFMLGFLGLFVCSPVVLCGNIARFCCAPIKDPVTLTVTSGGQSYSLVVSAQQSEALIADGKVISREHETNVYDGGVLEESGADKLEVAALLCVLGNYALAAVCYLVNKDKSDADRSSALDIVLFVAAVIFTLAPFFLARKYRKDEDLLLAKKNNKVNVAQATKKGP